MLVKDLSIMESIVKKNKNLYWDGWTVVSFYYSDKGKSSKYGSIVNGKWAIIKKFVPDRNGWDIPEKIAGQNGQA